MTYNDGTPSLSYQYDRLGRRTNVTQSGTPNMTHVYGYDGLDLSTETLAGPYDKVITHIDTSDGHRNIQPIDPIPYPPPPDGYDRQVLVGTDIDPSQDYATLYHYNGVGRLQSVVGPGLGNGYVQYSYLANSNLAERQDIKSSAAVTLGSAIRSYEPYRDLISSVGNFRPGQHVSEYDYLYDALGRRDLVARWGAAFLTPQDESWGYNNRNELTRAQEYVPDPEGHYDDPWIVARDQAYAYDCIGNRTTYTLGGGTPTSYTADNLNRYYPGTTNPTESFTYDNDGNLKQDGSFKYTWDGENRLTIVEPASSPVNGSKKLQFDYDYMNRRVRKRVFTYNGSWPQNPTTETRFVYDGWNLILELNGLNTGGTGVPPVIRKYTWGADLSGSMQGAGGIGGLLAMQDFSGGTVVPPVSYIYLYDANGNVGQLVNLADGSLAAKYEYDPYGNALVADGPMASINPFRFSTKYLDTETGMYYYGHRYYLLRLGRWANRDPMGEEDGPNSYAFVHNNPIDELDAVGLFVPYGHRLITYVGNSGIPHPLRSSVLARVTDANVNTDLRHFFDPSFHAQDEGFVRVLQSRLYLIRSNACICGGDDDRLIRLIGEALHGIQDFYSHTDWVEGWGMRGVYLAQSLYKFTSIPDSLYASLITHGPYYPRRFDIGRIEHGDASELSGVLVYKGGTQPSLWNGSFELDRHNAYSADEDRADKFRTRPPPLGLGPSAHFRATDSAIGATEDFMRWLYDATPSVCRGWLFER